jgi:hypothetical protein
MLMEISAYRLFKLINLLKLNYKKYLKLISVIVAALLVNFFYNLFKLNIKKF